MTTARELLQALTMPGVRHWTKRHDRTCGDHCPENAHNLTGSLMDEHKGISQFTNNLAEQDVQALNKLQ